MESIKSVTIQYLPQIEESDASRQLTAGKFLFPGFTYEFSLVGKQLPGGKFKYVTGLDENLVEDSKKEELKEVKAELENYYGAGALEPMNEEFWKTMKLVLNKKTTFLDISSNPEHKLFYYLIKGGSIPEIAPSYDQAISGDKPTRWFLAEPEQFADLNAADDRSKNDAIYWLTDLDKNKTYDDMMLVHKALISSDRGITRQTPKSALYKDLSDFIHGKLVKTDKKRTPAQFVETCELIKKDKKKLYITSYVKDAIYFNFINVNQDNQFQNVETKAKYGTNIEAVISKLSNPAYQDELENIKLKVEKKWSE